MIGNVLEPDMFSLSVWRKPWSWALWYSCRKNYAFPVCCFLHFMVQYVAAIMMLAEASAIDMVW